MPTKAEIVRAAGKRRLARVRAASLKKRKAAFQKKQKEKKSKPRGANKNIA